MIDGVEILAMEEVTVGFGFHWELFWLVFVAAMVIMSLIVGIGCFSDVGGWSFLLALIAGIVFGSLFGVLVARNSLPTEYETQYKVIISDEVQMNDFLSKYEIINTEGKIYTVRERNDE